MNTQRPSILSNWRHDLIYWAELAVACVVFLVMNILTPYIEKLTRAKPLIGEVDKK